VEAGEGRTKGGDEPQKCPEGPDADGERKDKGRTWDRTGVEGVGHRKTQTGPEGGGPASAGKLRGGGAVLVEIEILRRRLGRKGWRERD